MDNTKRPKIAWRLFFYSAGRLIYLLTGLGYNTIMKSRRKVSKTMTIGQVIKKYPRAAFVFLDYGLHCFRCPMAMPETIEEAAELHRLNLKNFLKDLNKAAAKGAEILP